MHGYCAPRVAARRVLRCSEIFSFCRGNSSLSDTIFVSSCSPYYGLCNGPSTMRILPTFFEFSTSEVLCSKGSSTWRCVLAAAIAAINNGPPQRPRGLIIHAVSYCRCAPPSRPAALSRIQSLDLGPRAARRHV